MDKLKNLKEQIETIQAKSVLASDMRSFIQLVLKIIKETKDNFDSISKENLATIQQAIQYIEQEHNKVINSVSQETKEVKLDFAKQVKELKDLIAKVKTIKPIDGQDGYTPVKGEDYFTEKELKTIKDEVLKETLKKIPKLDDTKIVDEVKKKLKKEKYISQEDLDRALSILDQRTSYLLQKPSGTGGGITNITGYIEAGTNVTLDGSGTLADPYVVNATGGGGGAVDSVNGQTGVVVLDADDIDDTATTNKFVTATDLTKLSNLSGTNTGDQNLSGYAEIANLGAVAFSNDYDDLDNKPTIPTGTIDGTLTSNELVYSVDSNTVGSLAVATYPSLTEISYVKGVTSSIQTQLNSKLSANQTITLSGDVTGSGATSITTTIANGAVDIAMLSATGTPSSSTYLRGDNTWATISAGGDVSKVGTPANNQIGVWTGDGTIEGDANLTFDTATDTLTSVNINATTFTGALTGTASGNEVPLTFSTGLTRTVDTITVNTTQNIAKLSNLTSNGFVKTSGGDGTLSIDTNTYLTSLSGAVLTDQTVGQTIGATGARLTKLWATDITVTNAIAGSITGNAGTVTNGLYTTDVGSVVQAYDADLTTWAGITPGTGVGTALAVNVGTAGAFVVNGGALGTPSSGNASNLTNFPTLNQNTTGSAATLTTTRTIWGQNFNGSANVTGSLTAVTDITGGASNMVITAGTGNSRTLTLRTTTSGGTATAAITLSATQTATFGGTVILGSNSITMTGSLAATGARVTKGWFTDIESTNMPTVGGTSLTTVAQTFQNKTITNSNNVLGGVTMTLGSDADGDTYYRASNVLTRLPKGTANQVLTMNAGATAPEWQNPAGGGGWTLIHYAAGTGVSELTKSSLDLSTDLQYKFIIWFESGITTARNIKMQINSVTSGSTYNNQIYEFQHTGASSTNGNRDLNSVDAWNIDNNSSANSFNIEGIMNLRSDGSAVRPVFQFQSSAMGNGATGSAYNRTAVGSLSQNSQTNVTSVRVYQTAGTGNWKLWILKPNTA